MFKIAIDGPAGAGKSTIAKLLAEKLNIEYIDTGAMYRAITLKALELGINIENEDEYTFLSTTTLDFVSGKIIMDGKDVSKDIRSIKVTTNAWAPSKMKSVRTFLVSLQQKIAESKSIVMDGRDIGTVVLPNAELKIYLDASVDERARRRVQERLEQGIVSTFEDTKAEIASRDYSDMNREIGPLKVAEDAVVIDSTLLSIDEVVKKIIDFMNERGLFNMSETEFKEGLEVTGTIINVKKEAIYVEFDDGEIRGAMFTNDLEGFVEGQKLSDRFHEGEPFTALVKQVSKDRKSDKPYIILSTKLYAAREKMPHFEELKENDEVIEAKLVDVNKGGADLEYDDYKIFLPLKNCLIKVEELRKMRGKKIPVIISSVYPENLKVIASQAMAQRKLARIAKEEALANIHEGDVVEGTVESILEFGAIVNVGGVTGLLHQSELDFKRFAKVSEYVTVGETVKVKVLKVEDGKIALSMRALKVHPWDALKEQYHVGDVFEGTVNKIIPAGLIIDLTENYRGLMPNQEYSWYSNERIQGHVAEGDKITVKVISIDDEKKRVSLSHKQTVENAWSGISLKRGDQIEVEISSIEEKGAKVAYSTVEGFLPVGEVGQGKRVQKVDEVYPVGTKLTVSVLDCAPQMRKLVVSVRSLENQKERATFESYKKAEQAETTESTIGDLLGSQFEDYFKTKKTK